MNISDLNVRIAIEECTLNTNSNGYEQREWINIRNIWSKVENIGSNEFAQADKSNIRVTNKFIIRYDKTLLQYYISNLRVKYNNKKFLIKNIDETETTKTYMYIIAEVVNDGS